MGAAQSGYPVLSAVTVTAWLLLPRVVASVIESNASPRTSKTPTRLNGEARLYLRGGLCAPLPDDLHKSQRELGRRRHPASVALP